MNRGNQLCMSYVCDSGRVEMFVSEYSVEQKVPEKPCS